MRGVTSGTAASRRRGIEHDVSQPVPERPDDDPAGNPPPAGETTSSAPPEPNEAEAAWGAPPGDVSGSQSPESTEVDSADVDSADVRQPLDRRAIRLWRIGAGITWVVLTALACTGAGIVYFNASAPAPAIVGSAAALLSLLPLIHAIWWPAVAYRHYDYLVDGDGVEIRHGVVWKSVLYIPRSRVQHTDVNSGPIERLLGLSHLIIHTAGTSNASVTLPGLSNETAIELRDHLVSSEADDAV